MPRPLPAAHKSTRKGAYIFTFGVRSSGGGLLGHDKQIKRSRFGFEHICPSCRHADMSDARRCPQCGVTYPVNGYTQTPPLVVP